MFWAIHLGVVRHPVESADPASTRGSYTQYSFSTPSRPLPVAAWVRSPRQQGAGTCLSLCIDLFTWRRFLCGHDCRGSRKAGTAIELSSDLFTRCFFFVASFPATFLPGGFFFVAKTAAAERGIQTPLSFLATFSPGVFFFCWLRAPRKEEDWSRS